MGMGAASWKPDMIGTFCTAAEREADICPINRTLWQLGGWTQGEGYDNEGDGEKPWEHATMPSKGEL